jgi:hypothetical protein
MLVDLGQVVCHRLIDCLFMFAELRSCFKRRDEVGELLVAVEE